MFRIQDNVPQWYVNESRDFQLFCRLYDIAFTSVKCDIDNILNITNSYECPDRLLDLLSTRIGFFDYKSLPTDALRLVLSAFPYIMKHKGTVTAVKECINLYLRYNKAQNVEYEIDTSEGNVTLTLETTFGNEYILDILLSYVIPTGCKITYQISNIYNFSENMQTDEISIAVSSPSERNNAVSVSTQSSTLLGVPIFNESFIILGDNDYVISGSYYIEDNEVIIRFPEDSSTDTFSQPLLLYKGQTYEIVKSLNGANSYLAYYDIGCHLIEINFISSYNGFSFSLIDQIRSSDDIVEGLSFGAVGTSGVTMSSSQLLDLNDLTIAQNNTVNTYRQRVEYKFVNNTLRVHAFTVTHAQFEDASNVSYTNGQFVAIKDIKLRKDNSFIDYTIDRDENTLVFNINKNENYRLILTYYDDNIVEHNIIDRG